MPVSNTKDDNNDQNQVNDTQNNEINIEKLYSDIITDIDSMRSKVSGRNLFQKQLDVETINVVGNADIDKNYAESRCHAFYRLIGLPVVTPDGSFYSPGFDKEVNQSTFETKKQVTIANKLLKSQAIINLMDQREDYPKIYEKIFEKQDFTAGMTALTSSNLYNIRKLNSSLEKSNISQIFEILPQTHEIKNINSNSVSFYEYKDEFGVNNTNFKTRPHYLKPFIVDPRIDFSMAPSNKRLGAPFLKNKAALKLNDKIYLKRPYIETVCRVRFKNTDSKDQLSSTQTQLLNEIKNSNIKNKETLKLLNDPQKVTEQQQFLKFYNIFKATCKLLTESIQKIHEIEKLYVWIPIPDKKGPEFGSTTYAVNSHNTSNPSVKKEHEEEIIKKQSQDQINKLLAKWLGPDEVDLGDFAFSSLGNALDPENSRAYGDHNLEDLENINIERNNNCKIANDALRVVEILLGEFSGFGFCDIIVIYSALWLIDKNYLLGLLDDNAIDRASLIPELTIKGSTRPSVLDSLIAFESKVKEMYDVMQSIFNDFKNYNLKSIIG